MSGLELALLGTPTITLNGNPVRTDRRKAIALLAYLAVTGKPHTRDALSTLLWPDYDQSSAYAYLRRTIWELNKMLGKGWIDADRDTVQFDRSSPFELDTEKFFTLQQSSDLSNLKEAAQLFRGDFLLNFVVQDTPPFEMWQMEQTEHYRRLYADLLRRLVGGLEEKGEFESALAFAHQWLDQDTLNETAHRAIMRVLAKMGDRTGALRQYEAAAKALDDELGVAPQDETVDLREAIRQGGFGAASRLSTTEPGFKGVAAPQKGARSRDNLPVPPTPFIGRRPELDKIQALILAPQNRLITLVGPGGTGKTRLSIESARETTHAFTDGVWFVPLAPLHSADGIVAAIAKALDFTFYNEQESPKQQLLEYLREKQLLLVLDNFEHLLSVSAIGIITELLSTGKDVKIIVSSRTRLNVGSEQLFRVSGMRTPEIESVNSWDDPETQAKPFSAVQLFLDRARRLQPEFKLTGENLGAVTTICGLVRGMPLGIELAASWLELLSPEEIVKEISRSLDFLETDQADVPERQRSIRAVFESSWKMLLENERLAFQKLTVFRGGFSRDAGVFVAEASLRTLLGLVNKSWLQRGEEDRFQVHELLRQYAAEILHEDSTQWGIARDRHANYFLRFLQEQGEKLKGSKQMRAVELVAVEYENVHAAWVWMVEQKAYGRLIGEALFTLFYDAQARAIVDDLLVLIDTMLHSLAGERHPSKDLYISILSAAKSQVRDNYVMQEETRLSQEGWARFEKAGTPLEPNFWTMLIVTNYAWHIDTVDGIEILGNLLPRFRTKEDDWLLGTVLQTLGQLLHEIDAYSQAKIYLLEALDIFRTLNNRLLVAFVLRDLASIAWKELSYQDARDLLQEATDIFDAMGFWVGVSSSEHELAEACLQQGKIDEAFEHFKNVRRFADKTGNRRIIQGTVHWMAMQAHSFLDTKTTEQLRKESNEMALDFFGDESIPYAWSIWEMGEIYRVKGDVDRAKDAYNKANAVFSKQTHIHGLSYIDRAFGDVALMNEDYEGAGGYFEKFRQAAEKDANNWNITYAEAGLGRAEIGLGEFEAAREHLSTALKRVYPSGLRDLSMLPLLGIAMLWNAEGSQEKAAAAATYVANSFLSWNETKALARDVLVTAEKALPPEDFERAKKAGEAGMLEDVVLEFLGN